MIPFRGLVQNDRQSTRLTIMIAGTAGIVQAPRIQLLEVSASNGSKGSKITHTGTEVATPRVNTKPPACERLASSESQHDDGDRP